MLSYNYEGTASGNTILIVPDPFIQARQRLQSLPHDSRLHPIGIVRRAMHRQKFYLRSQG